MDAFEFADTVKQGLDSYHQRLKSTFPQFKLIYLIEDLDGYYSEKKNQLNRQMRENMAGEPSGRLSKKAKERNKLLDMLPSQEIIEEQLLWLQFQAEGDTFIHHCKKDDTAAWIKTFVIEIGHIPEYSFKNLIQDGNLKMKNLLMYNLVIKLNLEKHLLIRGGKC